MEPDEDHAPAAPEGEPAPPSGPGGITRVTEPGKLVRVMDMTRHVLQELQYDGLDQPARAAVRTNYRAVLQQVRNLLPEDDRREMDDLLAPLEAPTATSVDEPPPSGTELRLAEAQLLGWLEGLLQGMEANEAVRRTGSQLEQATRIRQAQERPDQPSGPDESGGYR